MKTPYEPATFLQWSVLRYAAPIKKQHVGCCVTSDPVQHTFRLLLRWSSAVWNVLLACVRRGSGDGASPYGCINECTYMQRTQKKKERELTK